jgi:hypothetical protein
VWTVGAVVVSLLSGRDGFPLLAALLWTGLAPMMLGITPFVGVFLQRETVVWLLGGACLSVLVLAGLLLWVALRRRSRSLLDVALALLPIGQAITLRWFMSYWWNIGL